ncbi:MAG: hypothetical protein HUJ63_11785 [Enterococcus sp.]|nr:hypothetical protein [Enterococcus sp.]
MPAMKEEKDFVCRVTETVVWTFPVKGKDEEDAAESADSALHGDDGLDPMTFDGEGAVVENRDVRTEIVPAEKPRKRKWAVDIRFCPASCVHHVEADTPEEAERIVSDMLANGTLPLTDQQKAEMMDTLLENVESVETAMEDEE